MHQTLTLKKIEASPDIQGWLRQFKEHHRSVAINMLLQLRFVSRDTYAEWLKATVLKMSWNVIGLYAVRKFRPVVTCIWNKRGMTLARPASSLGSEDFVQSVIAGLTKANPDRYLDHPSIAVIKKTKEFHAILMDDSSGSGDRLSSFLRRMFSHKTFLSRWSFGLIHLHIVTYARTSDSDFAILEAIPGSDHVLRVHPKSSKVDFHGQWVFDTSELRARWGEAATQILDLCNSITAIPKDRRKGYGSTMSSIIFYHSVPNNLPGVLWCQNKKWKALFPKRTVPGWLPRLLDGGLDSATKRSTRKLPESLYSLLLWIKKGRSREQALSQATGYDVVALRALLGKARTAGFINRNNRLTKVGCQAIWNSKGVSKATTFDRSLYVPTKWCVGRATVQPSGLGGETRWEQTESARSSLRADGDVGQTSLERTDAKTTASSLGVSTQGPSTAREGGDTHGPLG